MPQISVIVPVYKVEPYLRRCVDSILGQTFTDFELILVDDGSPDNCGAICDDYAARNGRVRVIHQPNGGLSAARNAGLDWMFAHSESQWLTFVDSDDWVHPKYLEVLLGAVHQYDADVAIAELARTTGEDPVVGTDLSAKVFITEKYYVWHIVNASVAWGKLYHRNCFQNIRFPVGRLHEDEFVTYRILFQYEKSYVIEQPLYAYFQNPEGIVLRRWTPRRFDALDALEEQVAYFTQRGFLMAGRERFRSLALQLVNGKRLLAAYDGLSDDEKRRMSRDLDHRLRALMLQYRHQRWITLRDKGFWLATWGAVIPGLRMVRRAGIWVKLLCTGARGVHDG